MSIKSQSKPDLERRADHSAVADSPSSPRVGHDGSDDGDDDDDDADDILGLSAAGAICPSEDAACCCLFPVASRHEQQPYAQSLSSLATGSTSSRSSACEVAASTEWLHQQDALADAATGAASAASADPDPDADPDAAAAKPLDKLRSSLHSLRLGSRGSPGPHSVSATGAKSNSAIWLHEAPRHHLHHQHPMSRGGVSSRRRSSAISAKSKAQYIAQYKAAKVSYFRSVIGGNAPVKERPAGVDRDAWR